MASHILGAEAGMRLERDAYWVNVNSLHVPPGPFSLWCTP